MSEGLQNYHMKETSWQKDWTPPAFLPVTAMLEKACAKQTTHKSLILCFLPLSIAALFPGLAHFLP